LRLVPKENFTLNAKLFHASQVAVSAMETQVEIFFKE
jgi:hypothetical protein